MARVINGYHLNIIEISGNNIQKDGKLNYSIIALECLELYNKNLLNIDKENIVCYNGKQILEPLSIKLENYKHGKRYTRASGVLYFPKNEFNFNISILKTGINKISNDLKLIQIIK